VNFFIKIFLLILIKQLNVVMGWTFQGNSTLSDRLRWER
jgi:hypothetical protein